MVLFIVIFVLLLIPIYSYNKRDFTIRKNSHSALIEMCPHTGIKEMSRKLVFDTTCLYDDASGENDWNKAFGFSYGNHHKTSFRIGWRYRDNRLETCLYYYTDSKRHTQFLRIVRPGTVNTFTIKVVGEMIHVLHGNPVRGYKTEIVSIGEIKPSIGYYLYPYFGGQEKAPHKMKLRIFK